jgi:catechol-2,3-dioxygenase
MSSTDLSADTSAAAPKIAACDMKLEVVTLPVSDVDRAKSFYESLGWRCDADIVRGDAFRAVQLTPPRSACSIALGRASRPVSPVP